MSLTQDTTQDETCKTENRLTDASYNFKQFQYFFLEETDVRYKFYNI